MALTRAIVDFKFCDKIIRLLIMIGLTPTVCFGQKADIDEIFRKKIEHSLISRGDNFAGFDPTKDSADLFLFTLHKKIPISEFKKKTNFDDTKIEKIIDKLVSKGWLIKHNDELKPTVFIADKVDGHNLYKKAEPISTEIAKSIMKITPLIKKEFSKTEISKKDSFGKWSFLILSNVLLDSWQIDFVESEFLKKSERPERHGKYYYYKISENTDVSRESFGIYGNQYQKINNKYISVYGNNRESLKIGKSKNFISKADNKIFEDMAKLYLPTLIKTLNDYKAYSLNVYEQLGYKNEIAYEEFYIWWYHFIYTKATDKLHKRKALIIPKSGNFEYESEQ